jgi:hypothetical protein
MPGLLQVDKMGPVDVAVIAFDSGDLNDDIAPALADLQASGTVRVMDIAFLRKSADGSTTVLELADDAVGDAFDRITDSQVELLSAADLSDLARTLPSESSAMVVVWENCWAARFASMVRESHGRVAMLERIARENVERAITALEE